MSKHTGNDVYFYSSMLHDEQIPKISQNCVCVHILFWIDVNNFIANQKYVNTKLILSTAASFQPA